MELSGEVDMHNISGPNNTSDSLYIVKTSSNVQIDFDTILFEFSVVEVAFISTLMYGLSLFGLVGNILLLTSIIKHAEFHTIGYTLMAHLAIAEMMVNVMGTYGHTLSLCWYDNNDMVFATWHLELVGFIVAWGYDIGVFITLFISFNRFISVLYFYKYHEIFTKTRTYIMIFLGYSSSFAVCLPLMPGLNLCTFAYFPRIWHHHIGDPLLYPGSRLYFMIYRCVAVVAVIFMVVMYLLIFFKLRSVKKVRPAARRSGTGQNNSKYQAKQDVKLSIQFFIVTLLFIFMWITASIFFETLFMIQDKVRRKVLTLMTEIVISIQIGINPLVYMIINERIRFRTKSLLW